MTANGCNATVKKTGHEEKQDQQDARLEIKDFKNTMSKWKLEIQVGVETNTKEARRKSFVVSLCIDSIG